LYYNATIIGSRQIAPGNVVAPDNGVYKEQKNSLQSIINDLDIAAEVRDLSVAERDQLAQARDQPTKLLREEEIEYYQRAKVTDIIRGDNKTRYFQMIANGKDKKKTKFSLNHDNKKNKGQENLKTYITHFYKNLFGAPGKNSFTLDKTISDDISQVTTLKNEFLIAPFTEEEVRNAVFDMEHNKAPWPDGFPAGFYQKFWEVIKGDLMQMFHDLHAEVLPLFSLNFGIITLLPKVQDANRIKQYRPIHLLNVSFKIFTKVATLTTIRINSIGDHIISPTQTTFV
jgi:hypothetical protein